MYQLPTQEEMLKAGMHFGHRVSKWHPKMALYIFGAHQGVHILDLDKTKTGLESAIEFMKELISKNKNILFVGTKTQAGPTISEIAKEIKMPYVSERWIGGTITNFSVIKNSIKKYKDLLEKKEAGKLSKYTKKEQLQFDHQIDKLSINVGGLVTLNRAPDAIFIWDIKKEKTALAEARKKGIPVIAICDTNVNPTGVDYVIPCNDDASKAIKLVLSLIGEAIKDAQLLAEKEVINKVVDKDKDKAVAV